jgi:hypothetical protein
MILPNVTLGYVFACLDGPDASFRLAQSDREILRDEVYHRLTTDSVIGEGPAAENFGKDVRGLLGGKLTDGDIEELGPTLAAVLQQSERIATALVDVTRTRLRPDLIHLSFAVTVTAVTGVTFDFLFLLTPDTFEQIGAT